MADILCMSRSSLLRKIKTIFNLSPLDFIRLIRLKKAAEYIQEGKYRIGDICYMVGINSPSYFSKLFLKQCLSYFYFKKATLSISSQENHQMHCHLLQSTLSCRML